MEQQNNIAIIIPAYKGDYLNETLCSLNKQTKQSFTIYIGDDNSPENLYSIIKPYIDTMHIEYTRFDENIGRKLLPEHWNRCLKLIKNEEWIWLFSDDDYLTSNCIEQLCKNINEFPKKIIFKFNSIKVQDGKIIRKNIFPDIINTQDFLNIKLGYKCESYAVEYVFHKSLLKHIQFPLFPLGWCSDDLFWIKATLQSDIKSINGANVFWRFSEKNISGKKNSPQDAKQKLKACLMFINQLSKEEKIIDNRENINLIKNWFQKQYDYLSPSLDKESKNIILKETDQLFDIL